MTPWHAFCLIVEWIAAIGGGVIVGVFIIGIIIGILKAL